MLKTLFAALAILCLFPVAFSQNPNEAQSNSAQQTGYSESVPYQQSWRITITENAKKNKKPAKDKETARKPQPTNNAPTQSEETDTTVTVPVAVFDQNGHAVKNLKQSDFKLFIDDKEQEISDFKSADEQELNIFLVLDLSPSTSFKIKDLRRFAAEFSAYNPQAKIQMLGLSEKLSVLTPLTNDQKILSKAAANLDDLTNGTSIYDSIASIFKKQTNSVAGRKVIILLTDGVDTTSEQKNYESSLLEAEKYNVPVYIFYLDTYEAYMKNDQSPSRTLRMGSIIIDPRMNLPSNSTDMDIDSEYQTGRTYLSDLAALSGGRVFNIKDLTKITSESFKKLSEYFQPYYYLSLNSAKVENTGQQRRQIKVRVNHSNMTVSAKGSYIAAEK